MTPADSGPRFPRTAPRRGAVSHLWDSHLWGCADTVSTLCQHRVNTVSTPLSLVSTVLCQHLFHCANTSACQQRKSVSTLILTPSPALDPVPLARLAVFLFTQISLPDPFSSTSKLTTRLRQNRAPWTPPHPTPRSAQTTDCEYTHKPQSHISGSRDNRRKCHATPMPHPCYTSMPSAAPSFESRTTLPEARAWIRSSLLRWVPLSDDDDLVVGSTAEQPARQLVFLSATIRSIGLTVAWR